MPSNSSSSTSDQVGGVLPAPSGVPTAPMTMPASPDDDVLTPLSSADVSPAAVAISDQTSIATAAIDTRPPPAIASMFAEGGGVSAGSKIQGDRSASSSSVSPIKTQLQPAPSTSNPTLSAVPTTTAAICLPRGPGGFGRHRELVYSRPGSLTVSKSGDDGASDEWQTTIRASTSTAGGLSALATGDPSANANGTGTARRRPHSFHAGSLESSRPPALVEPIRRAPIGAAGGEYRPPSTYLVSDPTLFDGGLVSTPTAAGLETATTARAGASQVDHQAAYFHELHLQQQQQQEHYQRMAQASATAAREQQQQQHQLSQHRGGGGVYLPYPPRQATGLASSMPPSYRNYPPPGPAPHHESPYGRPYPDAIEYAPYPSQYHQHPHLADSPARSSPSQPARHRGALPFPMSHRSVSNTSTASNQSCDPSFLQPSSTGYRNAGDDSDWSTSSTGGGDPNGVDSSGEYSHSYSSTSVSGGEERLTDLEDDVDVLRYPGAGTPALYGGAGGRPTAMHTDSEDDGEDELDDDEKDGDYLDSSTAAARLHARGSGSSKAKRRRDAALLSTSATIPQRVYTATPPHSMPPSSTHSTPYSYGASQQQGHYPPPRPHHPHESPQHYSYAHGHPPYGQPQPYPPATYSRDYSPPPSQLIPITAYDLGDQQIYQQHYSSAPQLPVVGGGVSTANAVTASRTKGARRAAKPSKIPAPQIVPNLNKRSRGRHVPVDPYLVRQKKGGNGRVYECAVPECGKCFGRSEHLKRHIRSLHTNEKPFPCPHPNCSKEFSRHDNLCQHFRIHRQNPADQAAMEGLDMSRLGVGSASDSNHSGSRRSSGVSATSNTSKGSNEGYDDDEDDDQEGEDADEGFLSE